MPPSKIVKVTRAYEKILVQHRNKLAYLAERHGPARLKKMYDKAQGELVDKLRRIRPGREGSFTVQQQRTTLAQVKQGQALLSRRMAGAVGDISKQAQVESLRGLGESIGKLEKIYTGAEITLPIDEAARFWGIIDQRRTSLMKAHEASMDAYGTRLVGKVEEQLGLSLVQQETMVKAVDRVQDVLENEWWQAERIVRTECAWASNATAVDGMREISKEVDDLYVRWNEFVDDDFEPLDDRVGLDSIAMHGQVARPGGYFTMPDMTPGGEDVPESLVGRTWAFPPDRPNDRASVSPWRPAWGGVAWLYDGGDRDFLSR